jgi:hypothetical protein
MYKLFYEGAQPPELPKLPKRKSVDDVLFGGRGKEAAYLSKFRRVLGKIDGSQQRLVLYMAQKMAKH